MFGRARLIGCCASVLMVGGHGFAEGGSLPGLQEKPWEGYFIAHECRSFTFGLGCDAEGVLTLLNSKGEGSIHKAFKVSFTIEEVQPSGKVVSKKLDEDSLTSEHEATTKPKSVKFGGKVTGGASFEAVMDFSKSKMQFGGKVTSAGELKNPLRFAVKISMTGLHKEIDLEDREFTKKVKDDELRFVTLDGKRGKVEFTDPFDVAKECGKGVESVRVETSAHKDRRMEYATTEGGVIEIIPAKTGQPLVYGLSLRWFSDPAKDPKGASRLEVEIR